VGSEVKLLRDKPDEPSQLEPNLNWRLSFSLGVFSLVFNNIFQLSDLFLLANCWPALNTGYIFNCQRPNGRKKGLNEGGMAK